MLATSAGRPRPITHAAGCDLTSPKRSAASPPDRQLFRRVCSRHGASVNGSIFVADHGEFSPTCIRTNCSNSGANLKLVSERKRCSSGAIPGINPLRFAATNTPSVPHTCKPIRSAASRPSFSSIISRAAFNSRASRIASISPASNPARRLSGHELLTECTLIHP